MSSNIAMSAGWERRTALRKSVQMQRLRRFEHVRAPFDEREGPPPDRRAGRWLSIIFGTFGLLAPRNGTLIVAYLLCALSASEAVTHETRPVDIFQREDFDFFLSVGEYIFSL